MAISASFSRIIPKWPICFPNALRSFAYFDEVVRTFFAPPTHDAPSVNRPGVQNIERHNVPSPDFIKHVFFRHLAVLQEDRRRRAAVNPHLVLFIARLESRKRSLHDERREFFAVDLRE